MASPAVRATTTAYSTAPATTQSINNPSSTVGDVIIVGIISATSGATITPPSGQGWQSIGSNGSSECEGSFFWRSVGASDPTSFTFTSSVTQGMNIIATAVYNADPTTPIENYNIAVEGSTSETTGTITPTRLGCLPLAFFALKEPNSTAPNVSGLTTGWSELAILTYPNATYQAVELQVGPVTTDTTTAISATGNWDSYGTTPGLATLIMVQPGVPGNITINGSATPAAISLSAPGATTTLTIAQSGSSSAITVTSSNTSIATVSPSTVNPPSGTVTVTAVAPGTVTISANGA